MQVDLNLLNILDALLEEGSVQGAAARLRLSSPAVSRALGRLRRVTGDQILVRTGRSMTPTPYAQSVREPVRRLLEEALHILRPHHIFDPATMIRTFTIKGHDTLVSALAPALLVRVGESAPGVTLRILAETTDDDTDLRLDRADVLLGGGEPTQADICWEVVAGGTLVVAFSAGLTWPNGTLDIQSYAAADHIVVSRRGHVHDPIDRALAASGLTRRVVATLPSSEAALRVVSSSHLVTVVPELACRPLLQAFGLRTAAIPLDLPVVPAIMAWHRRHDDDAAHRWMRSWIRSALHSAT